MIAIKKVAATPLPQNEAKVIDSFNTTDDKHLNAPSIAAVEDKVNSTILKADIAVITGSQQVSPNDVDTVKEVNYPTGFNKDNCVVISKMSYRTNSSETFYQYDLGLISSFEGDLGQSVNGNPTVGLKEQKISLKFSSSIEVLVDTTWNYKVVLLKIS